MRYDKFIFLDFLHALESVYVIVSNLGFNIAVNISDSPRHEGADGDYEQIKYTSGRL